MTSEVLRGWFVSKLIEVAFSSIFLAFSISCLSELGGYEPHGL